MSDPTAHDVKNLPSFIQIFPVMPLETSTLIPYIELAIKKLHQYHINHLLGR